MHTLFSSWEVLRVLISDRQRAERGTWTLGWAEMCFYASPL